MKRTLLTITTASAFATLAVGCGAGRPPSQLVDARIAYQQASTHPSARVASTEVLDAKHALDGAEHAFKEGDELEAKNLAYIAHRRSVAAKAMADSARAAESKRVALADFQRFREARALATRAELERAKGALSIAQQEAESQRQARQVAEEKLTQIQDVQAQKSDKGLVLTLSGNILFPSGKTELLDVAKDRLADVADALKEDQRSVLIVGHSDAQGPEDKNQKLSEARADAVRIYLIQRGVDRQRIRSEGAGESQPIADNESPEGRANNRRVEIILEESPGSGHTEP